jgi:hypothetical protein
MTIQIQAGGLTDLGAEIFGHVGCLEEDTGHVWTPWRMGLIGTASVFVGPIAEPAFH